MNNQPKNFQIGRPNGQDLCQIINYNNNWDEIDKSKVGIGLQEQYQFLSCSQSISIIISLKKGKTHLNKANEIEHSR